MAEFYDDALSEWAAAWGKVETGVSYLRSYDMTAVELEDRCRTVDAELATATRSLGSLELAVRSMDAGPDRALKQEATARNKAKLKEMRADFAALAAKLRRSMLLDGHEADSTMGRKMKMASGTQQLGHGTSMLHGALAHLDGIEADADETMDDLGRQRETILAAQGKAKKVASLQDGARGMIRSMLACDVKMKFALVAIIVVCVLILALILFLVLFPWEEVRKKNEEDAKKRLLRLLLRL